MSEQSITDPHLGTLLSLARERAQSLGGISGKLIARQADECATVLQGYIAKLHELANDPRLNASPAETERQEA